MSRRTFRFVLAALTIAGGLALAAPNAEAAGSAAWEPDLWSRALSWIDHLWEGEVVGAWEMEGGATIDSNDPHTTAPPEEPNGDQGWNLDPNG